MGPSPDEGDRPRGLRMPVAATSAVPSSLSGRRCRSAEGRPRSLCRVTRGEQLRLIGRFCDDMWNRFDKTTLDEILHSEIKFRGSLGQNKMGRGG